MTDYHNAMLPIVHSNKVYNLNASANVTCGYTGKDDETIPLQAFLDVGLMKGTEVFGLPENEEIVAWARALLGMDVFDLFE